MILTWFQRGEIEKGPPRFGRPSRSLLRALKSYDRDLDFVWNSTEDEWALARRLRRGAGADDEFVLVWRLRHGGRPISPGGWLIDCLRESTVFRDGLSESQALDQAVQKRVEAASAPVDAAMGGLEPHHEEWGREAWKCRKHFRSFTGAAKPRDRERAGTRRIYGGESEVRHLRTF